jgi:hypothetical protein
MKGGLGFPNAIAVRCAFEDLGQAPGSTVIEWLLWLGHRPVSFIAGFSAWIAVELAELEPSRLIGP